MRGQGTDRPGENRTSRTEGMTRHDCKERIGGALEKGSCSGRAKRAAGGSIHMQKLENINRKERKKPPRAAEKSGPPPGGQKKKLIAS